MGGLFSRVKTWGATDTLTAADLNAEFDNILNNFIPQEMDDYSVNAVQMQIQTSPGSVGAESLATSLAGELERLRFMIAEISGTTYWYQTPSSSIAALNNALGAAAQNNKVASGATAATTGLPVYLVPDGTTNRVTAAGNVTTLVYSITGASYSITSAVTLAGLTSAPSPGLTCTVADTSITAGQTWTQLLGENGSSIAVTGVSSGISAGQIVAFKTPAATAEYFIGRMNAGNTAITDCYRGYFINSGLSLMGRQNVTNGDVLTLMKLTYIYASTAGTLTAVYTNPTYSAVAPNSPAIGDYWFDMTNNLWKTYNGSTFVASGNTLIGVTIQDTSGVCVGARAIDFFANYAPTNDIEVFAESTNSLRGRFLGSQVSVAGLPVSYQKAYPTWGTALYEGGNATVANTTYYLYVSPTGGSQLTAVAPWNRSDLYGYYHPGANWRCLGYVHTNTTGGYSEVESFYKAAPDQPVTSLTAATTNFPLPYIVPPKQQLFELNAAAGAFTEVLPPPSQWKSQRLIYTKVDSTTNAITLQAWGTAALTTTANISAGQTTVLSLGSSAGLSAGVTYLISGDGIPWGTTATWASGTTATLSQQAYFTTVGTNVTFAQVPSGTGIQVGTATTVGQFTITLNTEGESVELMSDGSNIIMLAHPIPAQDFYIQTPLVFGGSTTAPTRGTVTYETFNWRRVGQYAEWSWDFKFGAGTAGSGDYNFTLPSPINNIDLTRKQANASVIGASYPSATLSVVGGGFFNTSVVATVYPYVMSATQFKVIILGSNVWASGNAGNLGNAITATIFGKHPVKGWWE